MSPLNSSRPASEYNVPEQDLYTGVKMVWTSYEEFLADFEAWSTLYTSANAVDALAALEAAIALPNEAQRKEKHASLNKELNPLADKCLIVWKQLESYIRDGFDPLVFDEKLDAAGYVYYTGASDRNWDDVNGLMQSGAAFIGNNLGELSAGGMPATFEAGFVAAKDAFGASHNKFLQAEETAKVERDEKVLSNNACYRTAMKMCEDGKKIFRNQPAIRDQFTWDRVQMLIGFSQKSHTLSGVVTQLVDGTPIANALVAVLDTAMNPIEGKEASTNANGGYKISGLKNGSYVLKVEAAGFTDAEVPFTVADGPVVVDVGMVGN